MKPTVALSRCLLLMGVALLAACATKVRDARPGEAAGAPLAEARAEVRDMATRTLQDLYEVQPSAREAIANAPGHAVFSNFGYKFMISGSGGGKGIATRKSGGEVFMRMNEVSAGIGFGVRRFRQVWVFGTAEAFDRFVNSGYEFGGQATAAAQYEGRGGAYAGAISVSPGVWVYTITDDGLMAEITMRGTKYYRDQGLD